MKELMIAVKRILRYVTNMIHYGLRYERKYGEARVVGYNDSDLIGAFGTSTSSTHFFLRNCMVSWQSSKQQVVALYLFKSTLGNSGYG